MMAGPTTEVLYDDWRALRDKVHRVHLDVHVLGSQVPGIITSIKLLGVLILASLLLGVWWGTSLSTKVDGLGTRLDKVEAKFDEMTRNLGRLNASIGKLLEQSKPPVKP